MLTKKKYLLPTACLGLMLGASAQASDLDRRYLALDQTLHGTLTNAQMVLGQSSNTQEITTTMNQTWQEDYSLQHGVIASIVVDHNGLYRMYYHASRPNPDENDIASHTGIMTSSDGLTWSPLVTNNVVAGSNLISVNGQNDLGSVTVFYDANAPLAERYKLVKGESNSSHVAVSSDGINFTALTQVFAHRNEHIISAYYDTIREEYVMYGRIRNANSWNMHGGTQYDEQRRGAAMHSTSGSWTSPWTNVGNTVLDPEDMWDYGAGYNAGNPRNSTGIRPDFYHPAVSMYHGQYIGMPTTFYRDAERNEHVEYFTGTGPQYPVMMHSLDGINFTLSDMSLVNAHSIIDLTPHMRLNPRPDGTNPTELEVGQIHTAPTIIEQDDKLLLYYFVRNDTHYEGYNNEHQSRGHYVTELRVDGFASIKADEGEEGQWHTTDVVVPGNARGLLVNAKVAGSLTVEVLDTEGNAIGNLSLADSIAFQGDETQALMQWEEGRFNDVAGETVQLRFVVEDGEIYSFSFSAIPEPASLTLLGLGGAMLLRRKRTSV